ncbi:MAG: class I SAM-dependent methyltransferase [Paracoccaceae bacterium]|nr:class I SAM-dependent methyltransferase [Paracoccaceae bacterium]MDE2916663.1 class I SAM-dependent methyltransferase [Paracoccaceae bacterium]
MYHLFSKYADRYDLHTPPHHYQHDHAFVLRRLGNHKRIIDIGCGTGVFLKKALDSGFDAFGIDDSLNMVSIARKRVGYNRVIALCMQELNETQSFEGLISLSWTFNYTKSFAEAHRILIKFYNALVSDGMMILQIAHAPNATGVLGEDRELGPDGKEDDVVFLYRFSQISEKSNVLKAQYVYGCKSKAELFFEEHLLFAANVEKIAKLASKVGFTEIELLDSCFNEPFKTSVNVFLIARRP